MTFEKEKEELSNDKKTIEEILGNKEAEPKNLVGEKKMAEEAVEQWRQLYNKAIAKMKGVTPIFL